MYIQKVFISYDTGLSREGDKCATTQHMLIWLDPQHWQWHRPVWWSDSSVVFSDVSLVIGLDLGILTLDLGVEVLARPWQVCWRCESFHPQMLRFGSALFPQIFASIEYPVTKQRALHTCTSSIRRMLWIKHAGSTSTTITHVWFVAENFYVSERQQQPMTKFM